LNKYAGYKIEENYWGSDAGSECLNRALQHYRE